MVVTPRSGVAKPNDCDAPQGNPPALDAHWKARDAVEALFNLIRVAKGIDGEPTRFEIDNFNGRRRGLMNALYEFDKAFMGIEPLLVAAAKACRREEFVELGGRRGASAFHVLNTTFNDADSRLLNLLGQRMIPQDESWGDLTLTAENCGPVVNHLKVLPNRTEFDGVLASAAREADAIAPRTSVSSYSNKLIGNKIDDPTDPMSAIEIAAKLWGEGVREPTREKAARKRAVSWMKTNPPKLPANLAGPAHHYSVSKAALDRLAKPSVKSSTPT